MQRHVSLTTNPPAAASRRFMSVLALCVLVLPLPMPSFHQHDDIASPEGLAEHVAECHASESGGFVTADAAHWHFAMPGQPDEDGESIPRRPSDGILSSGVFATSVLAAIEWVACEGSRVSEMHVVVSTVDVIRGDPRQRLAAEAFQRHRCALSCVLRC